ncbi:lantibiotic dehydratase [Streptomyces sp. NRRL B-24484]|uniref:lantibiotic dehydratase n=1 Tax=Streptomyces sp. NRRL B-24484 TaxID=1463833 RepID=UPI0004C0F546|nr:lantibiotic dehydratase [Streptomyces sp. NRRL B-24484]
MTTDDSRTPGARRRPSPGARSRYRALDFVMIRAPILPVTRYPAADAPGPEPATACVRADALARCAVAVSSLPLAAALRRPTATERDRRRLEASLLRYLVRLSTRPTPFGLNAGAAVGRWGPTTDVRLADDRPPEVHARLDMHALLHFVTDLESAPRIRRATRVITNPAVLHRAGRVTLSGVEAPRTATGGENVTLRATGAVLRALALARTPISHADLAAELLRTVPGATPGKVDDLLHRLWRHAFLLTDLHPPLTHLDPAGHVLDHLGRIPAAAAAHADLAALLAAIQDWRKQPPDAGADTFPALADHARRVTGLDTGTPVQVDTALPLAAGTVSHRVADAAVRAADLLLRLTPFPDGLPHITAYRRAFEARYGTARDVPVLELLDPVTGLGTPSPTTVVAALDTVRADTLLRLATEALHDHLTAVDLDQDTLDRLTLRDVAPARLPLSLDLYAMVAAPSAAAVDAGDFRLVVGANIGAGAAGRNLGRFAGMLPGAVPALADVAAAERTLDPDRVLAELVYLPEKTRSANVVVRPTVRDHEIGIRTSAEDGPARYVPLDELAVRISDGRLALIWDDGGAGPDPGADGTGERVPRAVREVTVCSGHMLNHSRAPAVCRFLADLSHDGTAQLAGFDWGPARHFPYLPRVTCGRIVLRPAQWRVDHLQARRLTGSPDGFSAAFDAWRRRWRVPRHTYLTSSDEAADHRLLLDTTGRSHTEEIRRALTHLPPGGAVILQEALPGLDDAWATGPDGPRIVELVVSMTRRTATPPSPPPRPHHAPVARADRLRPPGSDWTYLKLYGDRQEEDALLAGAVRDIVASLAHHTDRRFFLRYADPEPHLRLRLRGDPARLVPALGDWAAAVLADGCLTRFGFDVYDREVERYGGLTAMDATEALYTADSLAVLDLLALRRTGRLPLDDTALAVLSIDDLLAGIGLDERARLHLYRRRARHERLAGAEFRARKAEFCELLSTPPPPPVADVLAERRRLLAPAAARLTDLHRRALLGRPLLDLCDSYVHLHCNRLLGPSPAAERAAVELLHRTRQSLTLRAG